MTEDEEIHALSGFLTDCNLTASGTTAKVLTPVYAGTADQDRIIAEMKTEDSGLRTETITHVVDLYNRVVRRLLLAGYKVNTGLFYGSASFRGTIENSAWDSSRNRVAINLEPSVALRSAAMSIPVSIVAEKGSTAYIAGVQDVQTKTSSGSVSRGHHVLLTGRKIKIDGDAAGNGITLTNEQGESVSVPSESLIVNSPSEVIFALPESLPVGLYTLSLQTQYKNGGKSLLKVPHTLQTTIIVE